MGKHYVLRTGRTFLLGLDLLRRSNHREFRCFSVVFLDKKVVTCRRNDKMNSWLPVASAASCLSAMLPLAGLALNSPPTNEKYTHCDAAFFQIALASLVTVSGHMSRYSVRSRNSHWSGCLHMADVVSVYLTQPSETACQTSSEIPHCLLSYLNVTLKFLFITKQSATPHRTKDCDC